MMIMWKTELERYEKDQNWPIAIQLLEQVIRKNPSLVEAYVRMMYMLRSILAAQWCDGGIEENCETLDNETIALQLQCYFESSYKKFSGNAEYLFFMGREIHNSENYFGIISKNFAIEMLAQALEKESDNVLFKWAYFLSSLPNKTAREAYKLARYLWCDSTKEIEWLKSKGYPGKCVLDSLEWSYEEYLNDLAINKYIVAPHILLISDFINGVLPIKTFNEYYTNMVVGQKHPLADKIAEVIQSLLKDVQACQEPLSGRKTEASGTVHRVDEQMLKSHAEKTLIELKVLQADPQ